MQAITIGKLARQAEIGIETVRFYERRGLIAEPPRSNSGYRQYPPEAITRLRFIRRAKDLGFSLDAIGELLLLRSNPAENREQVRAKAQAKIDDIDRRLEDLSRMRAALSELAGACERGDQTEDCPILVALDGGTIAGGSR